MNRLYRLYVNQAGAYELVPTGYSALAALLGLFWALANGVCWRLLLHLLPSLPFFVLGKAVAPGFAYAGLAYAAGIALVYFPLHAFAWRGDVLRTRGYEVRDEILARSSRQALAQYAKAQSGAEA